jgi:hypothetical protein
MHFLLNQVMRENKGSSLDEILAITEKKLSHAAKEYGFGEGFWRVGNKIAAEKGRNASAYSSTAGQNRIARSIYLGNPVTE